MTIRGHLFLSSLIHAVFVVFLLSLPLYRGSINFDSLGIYSVDLVKGMGERPSNAVLSTETVQPRPTEDRANDRGAAVEKKDEEREGPGREEKMVLAEEKTELIAIKHPEEKKAVSVEKRGLSPKDISKEKTLRIKETAKRTEMAMAAKKEEPVPKKIEEVVKEEMEAKVAPPKDVVVKEPPRVEEVKTAVEPVPETKSIVKETAKPLETPGNKRSVPPEEKKETAAPALETPEKPKETGVAEKKAGQELKTAAAEKEKGKEARDKRTPEAGGAAKAPKGKTQNLKGNEKKATKAEVKGMQRPSARDLKRSAVTSSKGTMPKESPITKRSGEADKVPVPSLTKDKGAVSRTKSDSGAPSSTGAKGEKAPPKTEGTHTAGAADAEKHAIASQVPAHNGGEGTRLPAKVEAKSDSGRETKPALGIPVPDILLQRDIKIETIFRDTGRKHARSSLLKKAHPSARGKWVSEKPKGVEGVEEREGNLDPGSPGAGTTLVLSVVKAERGLYIFVLENSSGETLNPDIVFHIFEGKPGARTKEFKRVELSPRTVMKFKFILPEAIFWDDESFFTGTIESSDIVTKFNDKTGLIWKEEKDY